MLEFSSLVGYFTLTVISWFIYKVYIYPYFISPLRKIPGPPSESFLYGSLNRIFLEESCESHTRWVKQYGNFIKYHGLLNESCIIVTDTKLIQDIFGYDFVKAKALRGDLTSILGQGISNVEGEIHKKQRKMMNPAFTHNTVKNMVPTFVRVALTLKSQIEDKVIKEETKINLTPNVSKATLDVIGLVGFNHEFNSLTSPSELADAYMSLFDSQVVTTTLSICISILSAYVPYIRKIPIDTNRRFNNACKVIERESRKMLEEKYHDYKNNKSVGIDLLSTLIKINKTLPVEEKMSDEELKYQIMTILAAGHDTTSTATTWALYLLAKHPNEQDLLREELVKAFPDKSKFNPTYDEINSLEYLNCVIKETLRLHPAVSVFQRSNIKDMVIGEHFVPKGTTIDIPIATLQRLPSIWGPTADNFEPKRWLNPSLIRDVTNYNYLPFGASVRSCIGNKIALSEFKVLLSMLVRNFTFQPVEGFVIKKRAGLFSKPDPYVELIVSEVEV